MARAASILGVVGFGLELLYGLYLYALVLEAVLNREPKYATVAWQLYYLAGIAIPVAGFVAATMAQKRPGVAGVLMLGSTALSVWRRGLSSLLTSLLGPIILIITMVGGLGGVLALIVALRGRAARNA